jgi:ATP-dependent Clp protease ATP-binding subunit ClpA
MMLWNPSLTARHFTDAAQRIISHIAQRALDRGMISGELNEATAGMLAVLSLLRWERKVGRAALEEMRVDIDALARELDVAIEQEGWRTRHNNGPRIEVMPSGAPAVVLDTDAPQKQLLEQAEHEALALGHDYVGTEHLLLAAIRCACPRLTELLQNHAISHEAARQAVLRVLGQ